jgi:hypothetical protein
MAEAANINGTMTKSQTNLGTAAILVYSQAKLESFFLSRNLH